MVRCEGGRVVGEGVRVGGIELTVYVVRSEQTRNAEEGICSHCEFTFWHNSASTEPRTCITFSVVNAFKRYTRTAVSISAH